MKYRAACPHCGKRFSRRMSFWTVPHVKRQCSHCGQPFRAVAWSEYLGDVFLAAAGVLPILWAFFGSLPWFAAIAMTVVALGLSVWVWPYFTIFEKVAPNERKDA